MMIYKSPSESKKARFLARLENLGLYDKLQQMGRTKGADPNIIKQL